MQEEIGIVRSSNLLAIQFSVEGLEEELSEPSAM